MKIRLPHKAVRWPRADLTRFGQPTYGDPEEIDCRWEGKTSEVIAGAEQKVMSTAMVFTRQEVRIGDLLMFGEIGLTEGSGFPDNPRDSRAVREVLSVDAPPSLRGAQILYEARLT